MILNHLESWLPRRGGPQGGPKNKRKYSFFLANRRSCELAQRMVQLATELHPSFVLFGCSSTVERAEAR